MRKKEVREYLYRIFVKTVASFRVNSYKAGITSNSRDIHRMRLDIKKIFALFSLFEMLDITEFSYKRWYRFFRPQYKQAGKIREIQVHYRILAQYESYETDFESFLKWLNEKERRSVKKFIQEVKKINEPEIMVLENTIFKFCQSSSISSLRSKTEDFLKQKALQVQKLLSGNPGNEQLHEIRIHLKTMATIGTLVYSIKPGRKLEQVLSALNKTDMMFGDWHDRVVLKETIEKFLSEEPAMADAEMFTINQLKQTLNDQSENLVDHFMPEVAVIVEEILTDNI